MLLWGVDFVPEYWGRSYSEWGCSEEQHTAKTLCYPSFINLIELEWAYKHWLKIDAQSRSVLTAASKPTFEATKIRCLELGFNLMDCHEAHIQHSVNMKIHVLDQATKVYDSVYYYEDVEEIGIRVLKQIPSLTLVTP